MSDEPAGRQASRSNVAFIHITYDGTALTWKTNVSVEGEMIDVLATTIHARILEGRKAAAKQVPVPAGGGVVVPNLQVRRADQEVA